MTRGVIEIIFSTIISTSCWFIWTLYSFLSGNLFHLVNLEGPTAYFFGCFVIYVGTFLLKSLIEVNCPRSIVLWGTILCHSDTFLVTITWSNTCHLFVCYYMPDDPFYLSKFMTQCRPYTTLLTANDFYSIRYLLPRFNIQTCSITWFLISLGSTILIILYKCYLTPNHHL